MDEAAIADSVYQALHAEGRLSRMPKRLAAAAAAFAIERNMLHDSPREDFWQAFFLELESRISARGVIH